MAVPFRHSGSELVALASRAHVRPEDPFDIGFLLLDRAVPDLVRCEFGSRSASVPLPSLNEREDQAKRDARTQREKLTPHLEARSDFGELDFLVRSLDKDVMPERDKVAVVDKRQGSFRVVSAGAVREPGVNPRTFARGSGRGGERRTLVRGR